MTAILAFMSILTEFLTDTDRAGGWQSTEVNLHGTEIACAAKYKATMPIHANFCLIYVMSILAANFLI